MDKLHNFFKKNIFVLTNILIALFALFYLLNLKGGHDWGGDFSMYIMNARNIVNGTPYAQTNYIYNLDTAYYGPKAYPPIFPLMLAPIIALQGTDLKALKLVGIVCFVILLFYLNFKILPKNFPPFLRTIFLILIGLYPPFFQQVDSILSDIPFLLFCTISLKSIDDYTNTLKENSSIGISSSTAVPRDPENKHHWIQVCLLGVMIYLTYGIRSVGITLLPVVFFLDWIRNKKVSFSTIVILLISSFLMILQGILIPETGSYLDNLNLSIHSVIPLMAYSFIYYFKVFASIFPFDNFIYQDIVFVLGIELVLVGLIERIKHGISSFELFCGLYIAELLIWPTYQGLRFLFPIIPFLVLFGLEGFQHILIHLKKKSILLPKILPIVLLLCVILYYFNQYSTLVPRPISDIEKKETQELFHFVQTSTVSTDIIVFFKPRVMGLFTGRKSVAVALPDPKGDAVGRMKALGVKYAIVRLNHPIENQPELIQLISENPSYFWLIYENPEFRMYELRFTGQ